MLSHKYTCVCTRRHIKLLCLFQIEVDKRSNTFLKSSFQSPCILACRPCHFKSSTTHDYTMFVQESVREISSGSYRWFTLTHNLCV
eukprot:c41175_g1_i1 orf=175-432(+)